MKKTIVIGAGASGLLACISSLKQGRDVLLIEKNEKAGKKIYITGKGRCNVTNNKDISEFFDYIPRNKEFLYSSLYSFDNKMLINLLSQNGLKLKVERGNRVFPESDKASDVTKTLLKICKKYDNFSVIYNSPISDLIIENKEATGVILKNGRKYYADKVILSMGGKSYKATGSNGYGYKLLKKYSHSITKLSPGLVSLITKKDFSNLSGLTLKNVNVTLYENGKKICEKFGDLLFTHTGVSGPVILFLSLYIKENKSYSISIDFKPALDKNTLEQRLLNDFAKNSNKNVISAFDLLLPKNLARRLINESNIDISKKINQITKEERTILLNILKNFKLKIDSKGGFNEAIITMGGVDVKEINPKNMESKIIKRLHITGEMLDVYATTGGYNLQIAFSTGYAAGKE